MQIEPVQTWQGGVDHLDGLNLHQIKIPIGNLRNPISTFGFELSGQRRQLCYLKADISCAAALIILEGTLLLGTPGVEDAVVAIPGTVAVFRGGIRSPIISAAGTHKGAILEWIEPEFPFLAEALEIALGPRSTPSRSFAAAKMGVELESKVLPLVSEAGGEDERSPLHFAALLFELVNIATNPAAQTIFMEIPSQVPYPIRQVLRRVVADKGMNWNIIRATKESDYSQYHLSRVMKSHFEGSFQDFVDLCKCKEAVDRLTNTEVAIQQIAIDCGFVTPSNFNRVLSTKLGVGPSEVRKACTQFFFVTA